jgi:hypothetical protein
MADDYSAPSESPPEPDGIRAETSKEEEEEEEEEEEIGSDLSSFSGSCDHAHGNNGNEGNMGNPAEAAGVVDSILDGSGATAEILSRAQAEWMFKTDSDAPCCLRCGRRFNLRNPRWVPYRGGERWGCPYDKGRDGCP